MAFDLKRRAYDRLPAFVKRGVCLIPFSVLAGKHYRATLGRKEWIDNASRTQLDAYSQESLKKVLEFAVREVPAYRSLSSAVARYRPKDALKEFPLLDKEAIQQNIDLYLPRSFTSIPHYETTTGGTSGNQLRVFLDDASQSIETAFMHRQWARVEYRPSHRKATFRGVPFPHLKDGVYWQHNPIYNELQFSPFHMSEGNLNGYIEQIARYSPKYLHGYPSALDVISEFVLRNGLTGRLPPIRAALCGSEGVTPLQRERIERAFGTRVYSWYGHSERLILAGECEHNLAYHHFPDYGVLEIVDESGGSCDQEGDRGELVGTGLLNRCMPLIRYRTGDFATRLASSCECGRHWERFSDVEGRWKQEMLYGVGGVRISLTAINMHGNLFEKIKRFQYVQDEVGRCKLNVMVAPGFSSRDRADIESAYRDKVGESLKFEVCIVEDIPLTARGKLKMLVSTIDN